MKKKNKNINKNHKESFCEIDDLVNFAKSLVNWKKEKRNEHLYKTLNLHCSQWMKLITGVNWICSATYNNE